MAEKGEWHVKKMPIQTRVLIRTTAIEEGLEVAELLTKLITKYKKGNR